MSSPGAVVQQSSQADLLSRCKAALTARVRELRPDVAWTEGFDSYLLDLEDNLLPGITPDLYADDYTAGAGGELQWEVRNGRRCPPKMQATYSSSALVVNSFALWKRHLGELELCGLRTFSDLRFEVKVPTGLGGTPPHLDFLAERLGATPVAAESKLTEFLQGHEAVFAPSYDSFCWPACVGPYVAMMQRLRANPSAFIYLNAAQLVKHAFGLSTSFGGGQVLLIYLFWEPENSDTYRQFGQHREEIRQFAASVAESPVRFVCKSYLELWREWAQSENAWLKAHAEKLLERYIVHV